MKPRKEGSSRSSRSQAIGPRSLLFAMCAALLVLFAGVAAAGDVIDVREARFIYSNEATLPAPGPRWRTVALPHREHKPDADALVHYWYRAEVTLSDAGQPTWLYLPKLRSGGAIFVNGMQVAAIREADPRYQVRWFRPHLLFLPPLALKNGTNEIAVRFAIREPLTSFGEFHLGPERPLRAEYDRVLFWENSSTEIGSFLCVVSGLLILVFWLRRPQEKMAGLFGLSVLFWGLRTLIFRTPVVPMEYWTLWRFFYYLTTSGFIACITIFLLGFSGARSVGLNRFLLAYWLGGSFLFLLIGPPLRMFMDTYWTVAFLPFTLYAIVRLTGFALRQRTPAGVAMCIVIAVVFVLALHDYAVQHGLFGLPEFYLLHLGIPAFLLVMAGMLLDRFVDSLRQAESANERLALRVAARERELAFSYEQLRRLERERAATEERQRIMEDMHDGVGSQLLSTLVMVQRGAATRQDMEELLQQCLDDMRLVIDSLSPHDPDLLSVLGNFRFRMESRFRALGLTLRWRNHALPDVVDVTPHTGLQILRIMQEALTNVLKHARATKVEVDLVFSGEGIRIAIVDDGIGFTHVGKTGGHGLGNMRMRARKIAATLLIGPRDSGTGTAITLDIPLPSSIGPSASAEAAA
jgi:signal transduction histidine kinase